MGRIRGESGVSAVEYGLIVCIGALCWLFTMQMIGVGIEGYFRDCVVRDLGGGHHPAWCED
jgi:Flp pilus assembly pilin Flp